MTAKDKSQIRRALGAIEGITIALEDKYADPILSYIANIDEILEKE